MKASNFTKILSCILAMLIVISAVPVFAMETSAAEATDDFLYSIQDGEAIITGYTGEDSNVVIPDTIDSYPVTSIGASAFRENTRIVSVVIPNSVTDIGGFYKCTSLKEVTLPESITNICNSAFSYCSSLESINIPDGVTRIGQYAFSGCTNLSEVHLPDGITEIGNLVFDKTAFYDNSENWTDGILYIGKYLIKAQASVSGCVEIKDGTTVLAAESFRQCASLTEVTIPESVVTVGIWAFYKCSALETVTISDGVEKIGNRAFYDCTSLANFNIPESVNSIGYGAFSNTAFYNDPSNWGMDRYYDSESSILCKDNYLLAAKTTITGEVSIKSGIRAIASCAFERCENITRLYIPESVRFINENAFSNCSSIEQVQVQSLAAWCTTVFENEYANPLNNGEGGILVDPDGAHVIKLNVPESVTSISDYAFYKCRLLENVSIPLGVTSVGTMAFYSCAGLKSIYFPSSVTEIGEQVIANCPSLEFINVATGNKVYKSQNNCLIEFATKTLIAGCKNSIIPAGGSVTKIGRYAFWGCKDLSEITLPDSITYIGDYAFDSCSSLESINIPSGVTYIGYGAFMACEKITSVSVPRGVAFIEGHTFYGCTNLSDVTLSEGLTKIGVWAFALCDALTKITIPEGVTYIGDWAFGQCDKLADVTLPNTLETIGESAFWGSSLKKITLPESLKTVGLNAFAFSRLESVHISKSVSSISSGAFEGCPLLSSVTVDPENPYYQSLGNSLVETSTKKLIVGSRDGFIPADGSVEIIGSRAFYCREGIESIVVPDGVTTICGDAFTGCTNLTTVYIPKSVTSIDLFAFSSCNNLSLVNYEGSAAEWNNINIDSTNRDLLNAEIVCDWTPPEPEDLYYTIENDTVMVLEYLGGPRTEYVIPEKIEGYPVTRIGDFAFHFDQIESIVVPDTVWGIGKAFEDCDKLKRIKLPESLTYIDPMAFGDCDSLHTINVDSENPVYCSAGNCIIETGTGTLIAGCNFSVIPEDGSVKAIGEYAFYDRTKLTDINIPESVISIGEDAFAQCSSLTSITIPESVTTIADGAFSDCSSLSAVYYGGSPSDWNSISVGHSNNCLLDAEIVFAKEDLAPLNGWINEAGKWVYYSDGKKATNIWMMDDIGWRYLGSDGYVVTNTWRMDAQGWRYIGDDGYVVTVTDMWVEDSWGWRYIDSNGYMAFNKWIEDTDGRHYVGEDGVMYVDGTFKIDGTLHVFDSEGVWKGTVPENLEYEIVDGSVTITGYTGSEAELTVPDTIAGYPVTAIGDDAFYECTSLESIILPESVTTIGDYAFEACENLSNVYIPQSVTTIGSWAFAYCTSLEVIRFPEGGESVGKNAFKGCTALSLVTYTGSEDDWNRISMEEGNENLLNTCIYSYTATDDGEAVITRYIGKASKLVIPQTIDGYTVTAIGDSAFDSKNHVKSVVIPECVRAIGTAAFNMCSGLVSVTLPDGLETIGEVAFMWCTSLANLEIPESVTSIGLGAFQLCAAIGTVTIPESITEIPESAFAQCYALKTVYIHEGVTSIGDNAFNMCENITTVYYAGSAEGWRNVSVGVGNESLTDANFVFTKIEGIEYEIVENGVVITRCTSEATDIEIPETLVGYPVVGIGDGAFADMKDVESIILPEGVTFIGASAFSGCRHLTTVTLPASLESIGASAFSGCRTLETVYYGGKLWTQWNGVAIEEGNELLLDAEIVFLGSPVVEGLEYEVVDGYATITKYTAETSHTVEELVIPDAIEGCPVTAIADNAFENCYDLESITLPDSLTAIGKQAFYDCRALKSITIPDSVSFIGDLAFCRCTNLESITLPNGITSVGYGLLSDCIRLVNVKIPESVTSISAHAFSYCEKLQNVVIPSGVTSIGLSAFLNCTSLESITIPERVTTIGECAFYNCTSLESITIPGKVTTIGECAFYDCSSLSTVYYCGSEAEWYEISIEYGNDSLLNANIIFDWVVIIPGDVNGDGTVNSIDSNLLKRMVAGSMSAEGILAADVNGDGTVNAIDSNILRRIIAGTYVQ